MTSTRSSSSRKPTIAAALIAATTASVAVGAGAAQAQELRFAFGFPTTFATYPATERYAEQVSAETGLSMRVFATQLLAPAEIISGVRDGIADIGWDAMPYHPVDYSEGGLIAELSMQVTSGEVPEVPGAAMAGAVMEYVLLNCPECLDQFAAQNAVYTAGTGTTPYYLICTEPVETLSDIQGLRIRTAAGNFERWAAAVGAAGVPMPGNETYDALAQGVLNCTSNDLSQLVGQRLVDIANSATVGVPGGVYGGSTIANWNRDVWRDLTLEQRQAILRISARFAADTVIGYQEATVTAIEAAQAAGIEIVDAAADLQAATAEFVEADRTTIEQQYTEQYGLENVSEKMVLATDLIEKWKGLMMNVPADVDAIAEIYWTEILSKVDAQTYGMD